MDNIFKKCGGVGAHNQELLFPPCYFPPIQELSLKFLSHCSVSLRSRLVPPWPCPPPALTKALPIRWHQSDLGEPFPIYLFTSCTRPIQRGGPVHWSYWCSWNRSAREGWRKETEEGLVVKQNWLCFGNYILTNRHSPCLNLTTSSAQPMKATSTSQSETEYDGTCLRQPIKKNGLQHTTDWYAVVVICNSDRKLSR